MARKMAPTSSREERACVSASTLTIMSSRCTNGMAEMSTASITLTYGDEKVANRDTKVWHGATEKGP